MTYRRKGHAEHDDQRYQPKAEIAAWEARDPITRFETLLVERGWGTSEDCARVEARVRSELDAAIAECEHEPLPEPATALTDVYANPPAAAPLWYRSV